MWVRVYHHIRVGERVGVQGIVDVIMCVCVNHSRGRVRCWCRDCVFICVGVSASAWGVACSVLFVIGVGERVRVKGVIVCVYVRVGVGGHAACVLDMFVTRCCCRCCSCACCVCLGWGLG